MRKVVIVLTVLCVLLAAGFAYTSWMVMSSMLELSACRLENGLWKERFEAERTLSEQLSVDLENLRKKLDANK